MCGDYLPARKCCQANSKVSALANYTFVCVACGRRGELAIIGGCPLISKAEKEEVSVQSQLSLTPSSLKQ